jgi:hypothetical protein
MKKSNPSTIILALSVTAIVALLAVYIFLYQVQPLELKWNDFWLYAIYVIAAVFAAIASTSVVLHFRKTDQPRIVWVYFSLGLWCWAVAELVWMIYALTAEEVASISLADVFWVSAYVFFALAFVCQFRLIYSTTVKQEAIWVGGIFAAVVFITAVITAVLRVASESEQTWFETFLTVSYPIGDLAIGLAALRVSQIFGRGLWGRVWWGLIFFAFSDALYTWLDFSGIYAISVETGNPLSLLTDTVYIAAYLLVGLACISQALLMHYGPLPRKIKPATDSEESL